MKRYRVLSFDFDARVHSFTDEIRDEWEESVKEQHRQNRQSIEEGLIHSYGAESYHAKRQNFIDLDSKPVSVLAFHNRFFEQVRTATVAGLVGAASSEPAAEHRSLDETRSPAPWGALVVPTPRRHRRLPAQVTAAVRVGLPRRGLSHFL